MAGVNVWEMDGAVVNVLGGTCPFLTSRVGTALVLRKFYAWVITSAVGMITSVVVIDFSWYMVIMSVL